PKADPDPAESAIEDATPEGDDSGQPPLPLQLPAAALQTGWSADHDGACSSPSAYHRRDSSDLGSDNATSSGEDAGSNEDSGSTRPRKGMTGRRVRAETIAVGRAATGEVADDKGDDKEKSNNEAVENDEVGDYDELRLVPAVDMVNVMEANVRFLLRCAETDKPMLFAAEVLYSGLYERVWHELPGGVQDFEGLGDTLVDIASVESVYDIFTDWDDRRTGHRHVDMLWAGPPRALPLCNASNGPDTNTLPHPGNGSMSCHSGSVTSQFDGEIEMVGFDDDTTSMENGGGGASSSDEEKKSRPVTSSEEDNDSQKGTSNVKMKKTRTNLTIDTSPSEPEGVPPAEAGLLVVASAYGTVMAHARARRRTHRGLSGPFDEADRQRRRRRRRISRLPVKYSATIVARPQNCLVDSSASLAGNIP
ncbi:hypothetical protein FOZ63_000800, partial [Perkinsus olseni]